MKSAARLNDEPRGLVDRDNTGALVKIAVASAWRRRLDFCSGSCVDDAHGSRDFLVLSLRSGASHVSGLLVRRS